MGIDFDPQAIMPPVFNIVIENTPVLIVIQPAQQQRRAPLHHPSASAACGGIEVG